jgi:cytosine deaminase
MSSLLVLDATHPDGHPVDIVISADRISQVLPAGQGRSSAPECTEIVNGAGRLVLPAMAEVHAHLDKAFLSEVVPNPTGDLMGAILSMEAHRHLLGPAETAERAERAARLIVANGATAIRTHADLTAENGLSSVEVLLDLRDRLAAEGLVDMQVVALSGWPVAEASAESDRQLSLLRSAIAKGVDLIGGCPHLEDDSVAAVDVFMRLAADHGLPVDLHMDETLDPRRFALPALAEWVLRHRPGVAVTASHCVSLGMQPVEVQNRTAALVAEAGISVVALPSSNLFLQGRDHQQAMPRALTAVAALTAAGVTVAAGADNLQDPFNPVGRGDCLETASLMVMAGHRLPGDAYDSVSGAARRAMGLAPVALDPGDPAELALIPSAGIREAIAFSPSGRAVIHRGRLVAGR